MAAVDWNGLEFERLAEELRRDPGGADGERMVWAFEQALAVARVGEELLPHLLAAATTLVARVENTTPREVLDAFFRRCVSDEVWRDRYLPLFQ